MINKYYVHMFLWIVLLSLLLSGCSQRINIENATFNLTLGLDKKGKNLYYYSVSPIFNEDAPKKVETHEVKADSIRNARNFFDASSIGLLTTAKLQQVLIGRELLESHDVFPLLDVLYRDVTSASNANVLMVDGPVKDVIMFEAKNRPRLPIYLGQLIDSTAVRNLISRSTLLDFQWTVMEKTITPYIGVVKKEKNQLEIKGTALLNGQGKAVTTLSLQETIIMHMLQRFHKGLFSLSLPLKETKNKADSKIISATFERVTRKVKLVKKDDQFYYNIKLKMDANLNESVNLFPAQNTMKSIEKFLEKAVKKETEKVIKKLQQHKVDPLGLGDYMRAYYYQDWKNMQMDWGSALAKITIMIEPEIRVMFNGLVQE
ncbi:Ger(x)C family spore germination protein [Brevibacillus halotolerans]|uniref:Ger(x)C family spore germination protein n=1 Tax=Brevibacillus TaxID=55080 RepID=UPI0015EEFCFF|nr:MULTISPECIES: Ger(x)C family spore germination protein [Brevibacillus]MBA4531926.1 Ger(x)C family spore germination protein [Brevibacillus halotolerans]MCR8993584.1 Ger(x)C family spore germination protein [Brevibacillus laterosporus]WPS85938.1 Ger(x)C family spore germination protein [Brevibacillus halotolerans]